MLNVKRVMSIKTIIAGISKSLKNTIESWSKKDNSFLHSVTPCYEYIVTDKGNGEWYHGGDNPLEHKWIDWGHYKICGVCRLRIERRLTNEG